MKIIRKIVRYKDKYFNSWIEFIMTLGVCPLNEGGFMIFIYFWGGGLAMFLMWIALKFEL